MMPTGTEPRLVRQREGTPLCCDFDAVATQELEPTREGAEGIRRVIVEICRPVPHTASGGDWTCEYRIISGLAEEHWMQVFGVDGIQAIQNALTAIGGALRGAPDPPRFAPTFDGHKNLPLP